MLKRLLFALAVALAPCAALAQGSILQGGTWTPGHLPQYSGTGSSQAVVSDGGGAGGGAVGVNPSTLGITARGTGTPPYVSQGKGPNGSNFCMYDAPTTNATGYHYLCLDPNIGGVGTIIYGAGGAAAAQSLAFIINGTTVIIPTGGGGTIPQITVPQVNGGAICANGVAGNLTGCVGTQNGVAYWSTSAIINATAAGTNGQVLMGTTSAAPAWQTPSGDATFTSSAVITVAKVNGVAYPASPSINTVPYVSSSNTITYGTLPVAAGGTGAATFTAHGVLFGEGTSPIVSLVSASIGQCLLSQGASSDPIWGSCSTGTGSAGGSNTQVQYNNASSLAGDPAFTWVSPKLTIGLNATTTGQLALANGGALGTSVTIQNLGNTTPYNFNLPTTAGTNGQPMLSAGGGAASMTFGTLGVAGGGTNCSVASGTCLDNITGFASTGYINRTGAGTYVFQAQITLANGGTSANLTASNGGIFYSTASAGAILSGTSTANQILMSGASTTPAWSTATYPPTTTINQLLYSSSANVIGGLATANNAILVTGGTGIPSIGTTIPSAVQLNITNLGTITTGVWQATPVALLYGGTNAALTASNGGIFYSTATAGAILSGTATASLPLLSAASSAPTWATVSYPTSATSGGIPYFSSTSVMASSALLTQYGVVYGGGAGAAPVATAAGATGTILTGSATVPLWTTATYPSTAASGTILAAGTSNVITATATPSIGTSLAVGGCTIGGNAFCVCTGTSLFTGGVTLTSASFSIGGNLSASAWTTSGVRMKIAAASYTDTTSTGTVATAYTDLVGASTILASSATVYTNYFGRYLQDPVASTNVTMTNKWALGADSAKFGTSSQVTISTTGVITATNAVFTTPNIGAATATSVNGLIITASAGTLTIPNNASAALILSGNFGTTITSTATTNSTLPAGTHTLAALDLADQTLSGGANVTSSNQGTKSSGTFTVDCGTSPLQYIVNGGAFTLAAPSNDGSCIVRSVNNGSAGTITFSGFTVGSNTGDSLTTTNTSAFAIQIWRINGVSRYLISAYQ